MAVASTSRFLANKTSKAFAGAMAMNYGPRVLMGDTSPSSLLGAGAETLAALYFPAAIWGGMIVQGGSAVGGMVINKIEEQRGNVSKYYGRNFGGGYVDTNQSYTMRQAANRAMQQSGMQMQQILGNEASFLHR